MCFHHRVWYRALSLRHACNRSSGIILYSLSPSHRLPLCQIYFVSFASSSAELAHGEKLRTQSLTQSLSIFDELGTEAFALEEDEHAVKMALSVKQLTV